jgi:dihydropyrimidinase
MLPLLFDRGVHGGRTTLARLVATLATNPARVLGLGGRKGSLAIGADADFVVFDPDARFTIDSASEHGNAYYSLYEGWKGRGVVRSVYGRGEPLLVDGTVVAAPGRGRHLTRTGVGTERVLV